MRAQEKTAGESFRWWQAGNPVSKGGTKRMDAAVKRRLRWMTLTLAAALVFTGAWSVAAGRRLVRGRQQVESAIEGLDLRLEQRNALLPGLVSAAENSPQLDPDAVEQLKAARDAMTSAVTMDEKIAADEQLSQAVLYLLALPEGEGITGETSQLQTMWQKLTDVETQMAAARESYNEAVLSYNNDLSRFPGCFVGQMLGLEYYNAFTVSAGTQGASVVCEE